MKYPAKQFELLTAALRQLSMVINVRGVHPCHLHHVVFQQGSEGQKHNWIYQKDCEVRRAHAIADMDGWKKVANVPETFELYPEGCNDSHIETAVKKALKAI